MNAAETELILNADQSVYHLKLRKEHIADNVILVGDPGRVERISSKFDSIDHKINNREFTTHTGSYKGIGVTALSTGIGCDNIDIVVNELDAAVNMDPDSKEPNKNLRSLRLIRLGTCGGLQADMEVEEVAISAYSIGFDGVKHFYDMREDERERLMREAFEEHLKASPNINQPYVCAADDKLLHHFSDIGTMGITITANGFFGPQGRYLRLPLATPNFNQQLTAFQHEQWRIINYEMESSALYALGKALGHQCLCMCVVIGNRLAGKFSKDYHPAVDYLIESTLNGLVSMK